jgi:death-on-curing protein
MQYLAVDDVVAFFAELIGTPVLRNPDGLQSAVARPQQSAFGSDAYPTIFLKAASLLQSLAQNQPFVDGNKRIAWICTKLFLQLHGITMRASESEGLDLMRDKVAQGLSVDAIASWIEDHSYSIIGGLKGTEYSELRAV